MKAFPLRIETAFRLLAEGRVSELRSRLAGRFSLRLFERTVAHGLRRDLAVPFLAPEARIPIHVREAVDADAALLFAVDHPGLGPAERAEIGWRRAHFYKRIPTCFVAIDERCGTPCYVQWLMTSDSNAEIQKLGSFPRLCAGEALLENAYTPPAYRGLGIMAAAMARIAERGQGLGVRYVTTFVGHDNIPSLKGCERAGFSRHSKRTITSWLFNLIRHVDFSTLDGEAGANSTAFRPR